MVFGVGPPLWFALETKLPTSEYHGHMAITERERAEQLLIDARWQGSATCPVCGSVRCSDQSVGAGAMWSIWRCGDCRRRFTVTSSTAIHSTKLSPSAWVAVAELQDPSASSVAEEIGVSRVTARKIAALLGPVKSRSFKERLRHLLCNGPQRHPTRDPWQIDPLPATLRATDSPLPTLSHGSKSVLNALRARPFGATAAKIAQLAGVSYSQTLRCLAALEQRGWVESTKSTIQHGYELRQATVWSLSWSDGAMVVLSFLRDVPTQRPRETDDEVPQRFWRSFWSGASADTLRISQHGLHIAETLVGGRDPCARAWALSALPTGVLQECRALRGFDTGLRAELLDGEIARRAVAP